jgi:pimeloyl-ACP methyl ester carboxylesterase
VGVIRALGHDRVDLLGQSMSGMVAQAVAARAPELVGRLILSSTGPAGGPGLERVTRVTLATVLRAVATFQDPKTLLFFNRTAAGKTAASDYLMRLKERTIQRDRPVTPVAVRAQLAAVHRWALRTPLDLSGFTGPALIVHGGDDRLVQIANASALARHLPTATLTAHPHAGHGVIFQHHAEFVAVAREFLRR